jgi:hypothetical protein
MKRVRFKSIEDIKLKIRSNISTGEEECKEDVNLVDALKSVKKMIDVVNSNLNSIDDPQLIEGYVYELKSLHVKYDYLIVVCKQRGLTADFY